MIRKIYTYILIAVAVISFASCDHDEILDVAPTNSLNAKDVFASPEAIETFRNGMYSNLAYSGSAFSGTALYTTQLPILGDLLGNDMVYGNTWFRSWGNDYEFKSSRETYGTRVLFSQTYYFAEIANTMVSAKISGIPEETIAQYKAEAKALRAMVQSDVARFYGKAYHLDQGASKAIPYIDYIDYGAFPTRNTMSEIYEKAIDDLKSAIEALPSLAEGGSKFHMNKNAAAAVLSRLYLDMHDWTNAKTYALLSLEGVEMVSNEEFAEKGLSTANDESILAFGVDENQYLKWRNWTSFHDNWEGMGDDFVANENMLQHFPENDLRRYFFIAEAVPYNNKWEYYWKSYPSEDLIPAAFINGLGYTMNGKFPRQNAVVGSERGRLGLGDYTYIRASEMLLTIAECNVNISGMDTEAQDLLHEVQSRSFPAAVKSDKTDNDLLELIRLERRKELLGEGHSVRDIKRWGIGLQRSGSHINNSINIPAGDPRFQFEIPQTQIDVNPNLLK